MRQLIVNADDFGLSDGVNAGIVRAHSAGIVTSTSLMVRQPAAASAAALARQHPGLGVGLHVDLGEWRYVNGGWEAVYQRVDINDHDEVEREIDAQLSEFELLLGRRPTHIDSHQHVHRREPARTLLIQRAARLGVPLRHDSPDVRYEGGFYGQDDVGQPMHELVSVAYLIEILQSLPSGITELACHPATVVDFAFATAYNNERLLELSTLCDPRIRSLVSSQTIQLIDFSGRPRTLLD